MADYAARYGLPDPRMHWHTFLALVTRVAQFDARQLLIGLHATAIGAARVFGGRENQQIEYAIADISDLSYPHLTPTPPKQIRRIITPQEFRHA